MAYEPDLDVRYRLLKLIEQESRLSQRELASRLGLSLGKTNYCLRAFAEKGWIKINNFRRSDNKLAYAYLLTPRGIAEKARVTAQFFRRVEAEYLALKAEIERHKKADDEAAGSGV